MSLNPGADRPVRVLRLGFPPSLRASLEAGWVEWIDDPAKADLVGALGGVAASSLIKEEGLQLTEREAEVLGYVADGWSNDEIASRLRIGVTTVKFHLAAIFRKFGVRRRTEAVREGQRRGMLEW